MTADDRHAKLAAALRANLKRRKTVAQPPLPTPAPKLPSPLDGGRKPE